MNSTVREPSKAERFVAPASSVIEDGEGYQLRSKCPV